MMRTGRTDSMATLAAHSIPLVWRITLLLGLTIIGSAPAAAFRPEFCAKTYPADRRELSEWHVVGPYFRNGPEIVEKMSYGMWQSCDCYGSQCSCCEFDLQKGCAEIMRINTTTMNRIHLGACEQQ
jgi:hypothetical protein